MKNHRMKQKQTKRNIFVALVVSVAIITTVCTSVVHIRANNQSRIAATPATESTPGNLPAATPPSLQHDETEVQPYSDDVTCTDVSIQSVIDTFVSEHSDNDISFSIAYHDLTTNCQAEANADQEWLGASTTKVVLALMAYEKIQSGEWQLDDHLTYEASEDYEAGAGVLQSEPNLQSVSIERLIEVMIVHSDNIAKNMLLRALGGREAMHAYLETISDIRSLEPTTNAVSADTLRAALIHLANPNTPGSDQIQALMRQTTNTTRLGEITNTDGSQPIIAHKIGDYNEDGIFYLHDIALIGDEDQYVLVILTSSQPVDETTVYELITELGNTIHHAYELKRVTVE